MTITMEEMWNKIMDMEEETQQLKKEVAQNKLEMVVLQGKLKESNRKIAELRKTKIPPTCQCGFTSEQSLALVKKVEAIEPKVEEADTKFERLKTLQCILSKRIIEAEKKVETENLVKENQDKLSTLEKRVTDIQYTELTKVKDNVNILQNIRDTASRTIFSVSLDQDKDLLIRQFIPIDKCVKVHIGGQSFDQKLGCFIAPVDGLYQLNTMVRQYTEGRLDVYLQVGRKDNIELGITNVSPDMQQRGDRIDVCTMTAIYRLTRGQRVGVTVMRLWGKCYVDSCEFSGCLLEC